MSQRALCLAVRDKLQLAFGWNEAQCDLTPEGKPPAVCGELFVGVSEDGMDNSQAESLDEIHRVSVVVTKRLPQAPWDRASQEIIHKAVVGAEVIADQVKAFVHRNYAILTLANLYLNEAIPSTQTIYGFCVPLLYRGQTRAQEKDGSWFQGEADAPSSGVAITMSFGVAERLQSVALQT